MSADSPAKILLVEDDPINVKVIKGIIALTNSTIDVAANGQEALDRLHLDQAYDLVLMDVQMPVMNGLDATRKIREELMLTSLPVIAVTTSSHASGRAACLAAGMNDFIAKPVMLETFFYTLKKWLPDKKIDWPNESGSQQSAQSLKQSDRLRELSLALSQVSGLETKQCDRLFHGDWLSYFRLLNQFIENHREDQKSISDAIKTRDQEAACRIAHTVKGAAATLGMTFLADSAEQLEMTLRDDLLSKDVNQRLLRFSGQLNYYAEMFSQIDSALPSATAIEIETDFHKLSDYANELVIYLQTNNAEALSLWEAHADTFAHWLGSEAAELISQNIEVFDFYSAHSVLLDALKKLDAN